MSGEEAKLSPEILQAIKSIETVEVLVEILKGQKYRVPVGIVENPGPFTVTYANPVTIKCLPTNWFSFSLFNDGDPEADPNNKNQPSVYVQVQASEKVGNIPLKPHEVKACESYIVDMKTPLIQSIYIYVTNPDDIAVVRVSGVR